MKNLIQIDADTLDDTGDPKLEQSGQTNANLKENKMWWSGGGTKPFIDWNILIEKWKTMN